MLAPADNTTAAPPRWRIDKKRGYYPIVYVRGFTPTSGSRENTFYDAYYGFAETCVEKRQVAPTRPGTDRPWYLEPEVFEGQLIRFIKEEGYIDAANGGLRLALRDAQRGFQNADPTRSLWISRFYDPDVLSGTVRDIMEHAQDLQHLVCDAIPEQLEAHHVDLGGEGRPEYKVILIAHSMGGLVCRCLIQNLLRRNGGDPRRWIHRFVTIATPHRGIELGAVPDFLEEVFMGRLNALDSAIFREARMREYLQLGDQDAEGKPKDLADLDGALPVGRCFCLIGSDHESYSVLAGVARQAVSDHSDGLVKQDRAYIKGAYWANIHRAHSGRRGIVNSFESFQNIRRFLFGDTKVTLSLEDLDLKIEAPRAGVTEFYDFEFALSIRGTSIYLHQRRQTPCQNAIRYVRRAGQKELHEPKSDTVVTTIDLHTAFLNTELRLGDDPYSHFQMAFRVAQHRVEEGLLWDRQYPERVIYSETLEVRVGDIESEEGKTPLSFRWLSNVTDPDDDWQPRRPAPDGSFRIPLRPANSFGAALRIRAGQWPDDTCED